MVTVDEERLFVISDTHIGNPSFKNKDGILDFLDFVASEDASLVINGDGLDFLQPSIRNFISILPEAFKRLFRISQRGTIYYVVGNHDIYFEQFLLDVDTVKVVPFLNVRSGEKNIRIEHAHIYDDLYIRYPKAYFFLGKVWGYFLNLCPVLYPTYELLEKIAGTVRVARSVTESPSDEKPVFKNAAALILDRGFDVVVFGHTHRPGIFEISSKKFYYNTGSWFDRPHYLDINRGDIQLKQFASSAA